MRINPRERRWLLALLPPFILLNSWVFDLVAAYLVINTGTTATDMMATYWWWSYTDRVVKWALPALVAFLLVASLDTLRPLGRFRQSLPWMAVVVLLAGETFVRFQLGQPQWQNTWVGQIQPRYIVTASRIIDVPLSGGFQRFYMKPLLVTDTQIALWALRPALAFLVATLLFLAGRFAMQQLRSRHDTAERFETATPHSEAPDDELSELGATRFARAVHAPHEVVR